MSRSTKPEPSADPEQLYSAEYLREVSDDDARRERLEELKRRIELGAYQPDAVSIAEGLMSRAGEEGLDLDGDEGDPEDESEFPF